MILSNIRGLKSAPYLVVLALIATLTFSLPFNAEAKSRKVSKSSKVSKNSHGSSRSARGAGRRSRGKVARGGRAAKGGKVALVKVRGRNGRLQWKKVYVARRSAPAGGITGHGAGVHNYLTQSWASAQLAPP